MLLHLPCDSICSMYAPALRAWHGTSSFMQWADTPDFAHAARLWSPGLGLVRGSGSLGRHPGGGTFPDRKASPFHDDGLGHTQLA